GVTIVTDQTADLTALRADHRLVLVRVATTDARGPALVRGAEALWALDVEGGRGAAAAWLAALVPPAAVTAIRCNGPTSLPGATIIVDESVLATAPIVRDAPQSPAARTLRGLARQVLGRRTGLALSAGGAKGLAHIGVVRAFER